MPWDNVRYEVCKQNVIAAIKNKSKTPYDYMQAYKKAVEQDDFELCKAITEVLAPLNYFTADTHAHIPLLNMKKP